MSSPKEAPTLPPHWEYNLKIDIDETAKAPLGPVYPLSQSELGALHEFIDEHLNMGFICPSNSLFGAPVLFVKKKDGSLQLCVNFWWLNYITQKDKYPLPLVSDLLAAPSKAKFFTKIDLRHADEHSRALLPLTSNFVIYFLHTPWFYINHSRLHTYYLGNLYHRILLDYPIPTHFKSRLSDQNYQRYVTSPFSSLKSSYFTSSQRALPSGQSLIWRSGAPLNSDQIEPNCVSIAAEALELFEVQVPPIVIISSFITLFGYMHWTCYFRIALT